MKEMLGAIPITTVAGFQASQFVYKTKASALRFLEFEIKATEQPDPIAC
jgi:hypothetical protein